MSEFSMPWLGLSSVLNKLQFMTWWQNDSFSKAWAHQNFSRQLRKRKGYEEQHSPCCLPPIGNQMVRAQDGSLSPGSLATYRSHVQNRPRPGQEPGSLQEPRDKWLETETESSGVKATHP